MKPILTATTLALTLALPAFAVSPRDISGLYTIPQSVSYAVAELYLLPNGHLCFTKTAGGERDVMLAGTWQADQTGKVTIRMQSFSNTLYPAWMATPQNPQDYPSTSKKQIRFLGKRFYLVPTLLGFGKQAGQPDVIAPLFPEHRGAVESEAYRLPIPDDARYLFIGRANNTGKIELIQYDIPTQSKHNTLELSYDFNVATAQTMQFIQLQFSNNQLYNPKDERDRGIGREKLDTETIQQVETECVQPILSGNTQDLLPKGVVLLTPKTIYWQGEIQSKAWF